MARNMGFWALSFACWVTLHGEASAQKPITYLGANGTTPSYSGQATTLPARVLVTSPAPIQWFSLYFKAGPSSSPEFTITLDVVRRTLQMFDQRSGSQVSAEWPPRSIPAAQLALNPPIGFADLKISAYSLTTVNNELRLDLTLLRGNSYSGVKYITMGAYNGQDYSAPWVNSSAGTWDSSAACSPTTQQLLNRSSTQPVPSVAAPVLPAPGGKYCDTTFGTEVMRISDNNDALNAVDNRNAIGFNKNSTKFVTSLGGGTLRVYDFNPSLFTTTVGASKELWYPFLKKSDGSFFFPDASTAFWSAASDTAATSTILIAQGMSYYKLNVVTGIATLLADLNSLISANVAALGTPYLNRCSASKDTRTIACSIVLQTATAYPRMGYVVFSIVSQNPVDPANNWTVKAKFINGIDSADINIYQTIQRTGSDGIQYTHPLFNTLEGGYKGSLDRSGRFFLLALWPTTNYTLVALDTVKVAANQQPFSFLQAAGHGDFGSNVFFGLSIAPNGICPRCAIRWDLASLTSDPNPTKNNGTPISNPFNFEEGFEYVSYFGGQAEATYSFACPASGCGVAPPAYQGEIVNLKIDGSGTTRRLAVVNNIHNPDPNVYESLQTIQSPDGKFMAFTSNFGDATGKSYAFIMRVP